MRRVPCSAWWIVAPLLGFAGIASAGVRPAVVELFTSEGCSSCPPAEAYLAELAQRADVLALTFHVNYWDDLGWPDRFGLPAATQRQRAYSQALRLSSVFTPQAVIDGRRSFVGSDRNAIGRELSVPRDGPSISLIVHDAELSVELDAWHAAHSNVWLVAYRHSAVTSIGRGENAGRTINEVNIVRSIRALDRSDGQDGKYRVKVDSLPQEATDIAVLLQGQGQASIIGAATLRLRADDRVARSGGVPQQGALQNYFFNSATPPKFTLLTSGNLTSASEMIRTP